MKYITFFSLVCCANFTLPAVCQVNKSEPASVPVKQGIASKPKIKFQYKSEGIEVPAATADEPKVKAFGPETIRAAWLKSNQRVTGRWWMKSLYRDTYQYITYISTVQALRALALCGEVPNLAGDTQ